MNVFQSLMTPGCLVRFGDRHGAVRSFNATTNEVAVQFSATGFVESMGLIDEAEMRRLGALVDIHFTKLRAGNDATEEHVTGTVTKQFPKLGWSSDEQRTLAKPVPNYRRGIVS